jgi:hypothetical protein
MAVPGEVECREVAPCAPGTWGDIPVDDTTQFVDIAYAGTDSDGSAERPYKQVQLGVAAAAPGAIVAIARGTYVEDVVPKKPVTLWGVCPAEVELVGVGGEFATITILQVDGVHVRDLAVSGPGVGIGLSGATDVLVDRVWIHDTLDFGAEVSGRLGPSHLDIRRSLVERSTDIGVVYGGATLTIDECVVRDTERIQQGGFGVLGLPEPGDDAMLVARRSVIEHNRSAGVLLIGATATVEESVVRLTQADDVGSGWGLAVQPQGSIESSLDLRRSVVQDNLGVGVFVAGSRAVIEATAIRSTLPQPTDGLFGFGVEGGISPESGATADLTIRSSVIEDNRGDGFVLGGGVATIESTIIRGTLPRDGTQMLGRGISVQADQSSGAPSSLSLRSSVVESNHDVGVFVSGAAALVEATVVRGTQPRAADMAFGRGIDVRTDMVTGVRGSVTLRSSIVEDNHEVGLLLDGADGTIESTVIRRTKPRASDGLDGRGAGFQDFAATLAPTVATMRFSVVEDSFDTGVVVSNSSLELESTVVSRSRARMADGAFGDGIAVFALGVPTSAVVRGCHVVDSARAGIASFGAFVGVSQTLLECNPIHLDGETLLEKSYEFDDGGGNVCTCDAATSACAVTSASLPPPEPIHDP